MRIFLGFSRGVLIKLLRLSYRLSNLVVREPQKFSIIQKKKSSISFLRKLFFFFQDYFNIFFLRSGGVSDAKEVVEKVAFGKIFAGMGMDIEIDALIDAQTEKIEEDLTDLEIKIIMMT